MSNDNDFEYMEPVVDVICKSLKEDPYNWAYNPYTLHHKHDFNGIEFWRGENEVITHKWNGRSRERLFSREQGIKISIYVKKMMRTQASSSQKELIESVRKSKDQSECAPVGEIHKDYKETANPLCEPLFGAAIITLSFMLIIGLSL